MGTTGKASARLGVEMTDRDIIERLNAVFPGRPIAIRANMKPVKAHYNKPLTLYVWGVSRKERVEEILHQILPYLGERRSARAVELLAHIAGQVISA